MFKEATATITIESPKVSADIEIKTDPESIIELKEIITKQQAKMDKKFATIANVDYNDIKDDPKIKEAFEVMSKAHLTYARKMPLYVREVLNEHLKKASETLEFDAAKLQKTLENVEGVTRRKAQLIARDQVGKHVSAINEGQNKSIGVKSYIWDCMMDGRERPEHEERHGKEFFYENPPWDGHAGFPINCRCHQRAVIDGW